MDNKTFAVIALVVAILLPLAGFILGIVALARMKGKKDEGRGFAIAAVVIGSLWVLLALFIIVMIFVGGFGYVITPRPYYG